MAVNDIQSGNLILIYLDTKRHFLVEVKSGMQFSTDLGNISIDNIIGQEYGYAGKTHLDKSFYCLKPSIADLMMKAKRKTTIVYPKDLGYMLLETAIRPGSRVIDIGTGSGAMAMVLARCVAPDGIVYSYDRREEFIENARKNITRAGYSENVNFCHCDVVEKGFVEKNIDAVFIDVPEPWNIVPEAFTALKGGHHLVSWSPNVEQVKRTVVALEKHNFMRIRVSEIMERDILVRERGVRPRERGITHTAYLVRAQKVVTDDKEEGMRGHEKAETGL